MATREELLAVTSVAVTDEQLNTVYVVKRLLALNDDAGTITAGLEALITALETAETSGFSGTPTDCVQCTASGKVDVTLGDGDTETFVCPLCEGVTKTDGQYQVAPITVDPISGYEPV